MHRLIKIDFNVNLLNGSKIVRNSLVQVCMPLSASLPTFASFSVAAVKFSFRHGAGDLFFISFLNVCQVKNEAFLYPT